MPLIKAGEGEIEARVGDEVIVSGTVCKVKWITDEMVVVIPPKAITNRPVRLDVIDGAVDCKLFKRPFMVGDEVEYLFLNGNDEEEWCRLTIDKQSIADILNGYEKEDARHINPLWRGE